MTLNEQFNLLKSLSFIHFPTDAWLITGGCAMQLYDLRENNADIDILVTPNYFDLLKTSPIYLPGGKNSQGVPAEDIIVLTNPSNGTKLVEVMKRESGFEFKQSLIHQLTPSLGFPNIIKIPYIKPDYLLAWKLQHNRTKDQEDIKLLLKFVSKNRGIEFTPDPINIESNIDLEGPFRKFKDMDKTEEDIPF